MRIEIETKFDIGDIVWRAENYEKGKGYVPNKHRILRFNLGCYDQFGLIGSVQYMIERFYCQAKELFSTKEECQEECDRLNKKNGY